jgi:hypothetical protein
MSQAFIAPVLAHLRAIGTLSAGIPGASSHAHAGQPLATLRYSEQTPKWTYINTDGICRSRFIGVYSLQRSHEGFPAIELPFWTLIQFFRNRAHHDDPLACEPQSQPILIWHKGSMTR